MKTHHIIDRDPNGLVCNFEVVDSQTKEVPDLIGTEPIIETFFSRRTRDCTQQNDCLLENKIRRIFHRRCRKYLSF